MHWHTLPNPKATWQLETPGILRVGRKSEAKNKCINQKSIITLDFLLSHSLRSIMSSKPQIKTAEDFQLKKQMSPTQKITAFWHWRFPGSLLPTKYSRRMPLNWGNPTPPEISIGLLIHTQRFILSVSKNHKIFKESLQWE